MNELLNLPTKIIGVAVIWGNDSQILIDRRRPQGQMGGLWEFPGGKLEPGETIEECIKREIQEELGIEVKVGEHLITIDHVYSEFSVILEVYHCFHIAGKPTPIECDEVRWVEIDDLEQYSFPAANKDIIKALKKDFITYVSPPI